MATVTFTISDITGEPLPAGVVPDVVFTPSSPTVTQDGHVVVTEPKTFTPNASGYVAADLISTDTTADPRFHYRMQIRWLNPDGYGGSGFTSIDYPNWKIRVPAGGGNLVDFTDLPARTDAFWVGITPPPDGYRYWVDISGTTPVLKEWSA